MSKSHNDSLFIENWERIFNIYMIRYELRFIAISTYKLDDLSPNYLYEHVYKYTDHNPSEYLLEITNNSEKANNYLELWLSDDLPDHVNKLDIKMCYLAILNINTYNNPFIKKSVLLGDISESEKVKYFTENFNDKSSLDKIKRLIKIKEVNMRKELKNE